MRTHNLLITLKNDTKISTNKLNEICDYINDSLLNYLNYSDVEVFKEWTTKKQ